MVLHLIMPDLYQEIIVKIIDFPYIKGDDVFLKVVMWGDPKKFEFEMKPSKTIWNSICHHMKLLEDDPLNLFNDESSFTIDEKLSFLKDRVLKIKGIPDKSRSFVTKDKKGIEKVEYPKVFDVTFEGDLEDAERIGGDIFKKSVFENVIYNVTCKECRLLNTRAAKEEMVKIEEKEKKKETKKVEEEDWLRIKRIEKEKEVAKLKRLEFCGWE